MQEIFDLNNIDPGFPSAVTIGKFDGVHRGHELLTAYLAKKRNEGCRTILVTFDVPPKSVIDKEDKKTLVSGEERRHMFENLGLDIMVVLPFTKELCETEPEDFIRMLTDKLCMKHLVCGTDFRFGHKGRGDVSLLEKLSEQYGFGLSVIPKLKEGEEDISSSRIRQCISEGKMEEARELLGYPYFIWGEVVHGQHIGTGIGAPTINLQPPEDKLLPPKGVYVTEVEIEGRAYHGITNVGTRPTFTDENIMTVETHILDFKRDVYENYATISFFKYIRPEMKFENAKDLSEQVKRDKQEAFSYFNDQKY